MTGAVPPFDVCGPLPSGITVLEASAGTGKTFTIAALAARFVADGTPLDQLLLVTFTRMATGELRDRVRERLVTAERGLARALQGVEPPEDDDVLRLLADGTPETLEQRRRRLHKALADFDAATIATIHGFCEHVLAGLGVTGDVDRDVEFLEDPRDLVEQVVDDLYVRRFHTAREEPPISRGQAQDIGQLVVANPEAALLPSAAPAGSVEAMRVRLAQAIRDEMEQRKRRAGLITYDDLLDRLATTLGDERRGPAACARLRGRYRIALVDEFQDTDPIQWAIFRQIFGQPPCTLVLIGDPKQAIYAFRGADVYAYLEAAREAGRQATLNVNWRSDQHLIDAYDALFGNAMLGHEGIRYREVRAAGANQRPRLAGAPVCSPLRVRLVNRDEHIPRLTDTGRVPVALAREHIAADLAADLVALLSSNAQVITRRRDGSERTRETVRPGHVAVLVHRHRDAAAIRDALDAVDIPAVINGAGSVFATPSARDWLRLLEALERPTSPGRARAAALTAFFGWSARRVATAGAREWEQVHALLHQWSDVLAGRGVASLQETVTLSQGLPGRILTRTEGERVMTDLRHAGELLHAAATGEKLGPTALAAWLRRRIAEAESDTHSEERSRRLESDSEAVQVLTIHRSKGLEFPIVYCPYLWDPSWIPDTLPPVFHDPANADRRSIDLAGKNGDGWDPYVAEERGQDLRLAYVALTRARHQAVVWWAGAWQSHESPLARLLFAREPDGTIPAATWSVPTDAAAFAAVEQLAAGAPDRISVEWTAAATGRRWSGERRKDADLAAARFARALDTGWRRTSYSGITAAATSTASPANRSSPGSATRRCRHRLEPPPGRGRRRRGAPGRASPRRPARRRGRRHLRAPCWSTPTSPTTSTPSSPPRSPSSAAGATPTSARPRPWWRAARAAIETPLGPLVGGVRLRDIARRDRVDELGFELPLVGGDEPPDDLAVDVGAPSRRCARTCPDRPAGGYADRRPTRRCGGGCAATCRAAWTWSCDWPTASRHRFAVIDHKTNWLGFDGAPLSAWRTGPTRWPTRWSAPTTRCRRAAVQRRAAPLPALAPARLHTRDEPRRRALPVRAGHDRRRRAGRGRPAVRRVRVPAGLGAALPAVEALSDLFDTGAARDGHSGTAAAARTTPGCRRDQHGHRRAARRRDAGVTSTPAAAPLDDFDARLALGAGGRLGRFNAAGVLAPADVHVAATLGRLAGGGGRSPSCSPPRWRCRHPARPRLHRPRHRADHGHRRQGGLPRRRAVTLAGCHPTGAPSWRPACWWRPVPTVRPTAAAGRQRCCTWTATGVRSARSPGTSPRAPVRPRGRRSSAARRPGPAVRRRGAGPAAPGGRHAVLRSLHRRRRGPGTGKTTTVARILALLDEQASAGMPPPRVALAAPTGKAAARLEEAVHARARTSTSPPRCANGSSPPPPRRCTACSGGDPARAAAAPPRQPAATTWSSSTRPRWWRCRSWRRWSRPCATEPVWCWSATPTSWRRSRPARRAGRRGGTRRRWSSARGGAARARGGHRLRGRRLGPARGRDVR